MFSLLLTALPTTIGVAQGVSAAKKEKESQDSDDLLRKFTLRCSIDDDELQRCPEAERWWGGGVVLRDGKVRQYANMFRMREGASALPFLQHNTAPNPPAHNQLYIHPSTSTPTQPPAHPFTGFLISYPDPTRPTPAPLGLVSSISLDPPVLNWIYVDAVTREVKYGNRTQSREHVVGSWGRGRGWLELAGAEARERLGEGGGAVVGEEGGVRWGGEGVRVRLERVFLEGVVEGKEEGEGGRGRTKFEGGTTMLETGGKRE